MKELDSIEVFRNEKDVIDEDNYIVIDTKEIFFRSPIQRNYILHDKIIKDIVTYHTIMEELLGKEIPNKVPLSVKL